MDPRSLAYLSKDQMDVQCGSCGKEIANISETDHPYNGQWCVHRSLRVFSAYVMHDDGIMRFSRRAKRKLKPNNVPQVRRMWKVAHEQMLDKQKATQKLQTPIKLECCYCGSIQVLTQERLLITDSVVDLGFRISKYVDAVGPPSASVGEMGADIEEPDCGTLIRARPYNPMEREQIRSNRPVENSS